ncbi:MAG TPA: YceI family protein [Thermoanaerobaculia bacterium]|nr:YceI family protein [Thermoanaerobaculia bacterium]
MRALLLSLLLAVTPFAFADETMHLVSAMPSKLVLEGTSNLAAWRCSGTTLDGQMAVAAPLLEMDSVIAGVEEFTLRVPISTLRCGSRQMERDMYRALRSDSFPTIEFEFDELVGAVRRDGAAGRFRARINGVLTLAGARRTVSIDVEAERLSNDRVLLRARLPLRMTDFRITPPTALFGMIKANDRLIVQFDLVLRKTS